MSQSYELTTRSELVDKFMHNEAYYVSENNWWALLALILVIGTACGNILVCLAITWERRLQNVTNYFLMSLAITDLMVAVLVMPLGILTLFKGYFPLPSIYCLVWICLDVLFCTASIMHLCTISVDRYLSLRYPMRFGRNKTRKRVTLKIIFVWLLSIAMSLPLSLMYSQDQDSVLINGTCQIPDPLYKLIGSIISFYIPLLVMLVTYTLTVKLLAKQRKQLGPQCGWSNFNTSSTIDTSVSWSKLLRRKCKLFHKLDKVENPERNNESLLANNTISQIKEEMSTAPQYILSANSTDTDFTTIDVHDLWIPDNDLLSNTPRCLSPVASPRYSALHAFGVEMLKLSRGIRPAVTITSPDMDDEYDAAQTVQTTQTIEENQIITNENPQLTDNSPKSYMDVDLQRQKIHVTQQFVQRLNDKSMNLNELLRNYSSNRPQNEKAPTRDYWIITPPPLPPRPLSWKKRHRRATYHAITHKNDCDTQSLPIQRPTTIHDWSHLRETQQSVAQNAKKPSNKKTMHIRSKSDLNLSVYVTNNNGSIKSCLNTLSHSCPYLEKKKTEVIDKSECGSESISEKNSFLTEDKRKLTDKIRRVDKQIEISRVKEKPNRTNELNQRDISMSKNSNNQRYLCTNYKSAISTKSKLCSLKLNGRLPRSSTTLSQATVSIAVPKSEYGSLKRSATVRSHHSRNLSLMSRNSSSRHGRIIRLEQKATKVLGVVFFTFVILWTPFFALNLVPAVCEYCEASISNWIIVVVTWLGYASSMVNPIFYTIFNKVFREAFKKVLLCKYHGKPGRELRAYKLQM